MLFENINKLKKPGFVRGNAENCEIATNVRYNGSKFTPKSNQDK